MSILQSRLSVLMAQANTPATLRMTLVKAMGDYERGHIPEGFALLGIAYTGQSADELKRAIEGMVR